MASFVDRWNTAYILYQMTLPRMCHALSTLSMCGYCGQQRAASAQRTSCDMKPVLHTPYINACTKMPVHIDDSPTSNCWQQCTHACAPFSPKVSWRSEVSASMYYRTIFLTASCQGHVASPFRGLPISPHQIYHYTRILERIQLPPSRPSERASSEMDVLVISGLFEDVRGFSIAQQRCPSPTYPAFSYDLEHTHDNMSLIRTGLQ